MSDDIELYIEPIKGKGAVELLYLIMEVLENSDHTWWLTGKTLQQLEESGEQDPDDRSLHIAVVKPFKERVFNDKFWVKRRSDDLISYNYSPINCEINIHLKDAPIPLEYRVYRDLDPFVPKDHENTDNQ